MSAVLDHALGFTLPAELEAHEPPEARGLQRDGVWLMVSHHLNDRIIHSQFGDIVDNLSAGDLLVINTSGTLPAALPATTADGTKLRLHLSTRLPANLWTVELREISGSVTKPYKGGRAGETIELPAGAKATLLTPYQMEPTLPASQRLWVAALNFPEPGSLSPVPYLLSFGQPIRYSYIQQDWPLEFYQTVYATEAGSAEMPSAGRAFTPEILTRLVTKGVRIAPLILHTGVASLEAHEPPYEEFYRISLETARAVNQTREHGGRIIAVGTTVVRALETTTDASGINHPGEGWTKLIITPQRGVRMVDGILTGWHEPTATHLAMLEAIAGRRHLELAYRAALEQRYLWHEFGDLHLILP